MSYMLQFPPSSLPKDARSPPYVLFGINDIDTFSDLPANISLALVLHFAPALRKWVLPLPELSAAATRIALRTPYAAVNILADIEVEGLSYILARMMQIVNMKMPTGDYRMYMTAPGLMVSVAIHKAWVALELPPKGIEALYMHVQSMLMLGPPVTLFEIKGIWHYFPTASPIVLEMARNFMRNYQMYMPHESSAVRHWYLETTDRWNFFKLIEQEHPEFANAQKNAMKAANELQKKDGHHTPKFSKEEEQLMAAMAKDWADQEKARAKRGRLTTRERKVSASRRRMERAKSNESLNSNSSAETVIWKPSKTATEEGSTTPYPESSYADGSVESATPPPHSRPVDSSVLADMLEEMAIEERTQAYKMENKATDKEDDSEENDDEMGYIPPNITSSLLRAKCPGEARGPEAKFKLHRRSTGPTTIKHKHGQSVRKALAAAAHALSPQPSEDEEASRGRTQLTTIPQDARNLRVPNYTSRLPVYKDSPYISTKGTTGNNSYENSSRLKDILALKRAQRALKEGGAWPVE